jgi:hypothetical protein
MPATSKAQRRFFGMVAAGKAPRPKGMSDSQIEHFASTPEKGLPTRANNRRRKIAAIRAGR